MGLILGRVALMLMIGQRPFGADVLMARQNGQEDL
jgi:hypothetical protein